MSLRTEYASFKHALAPASKPLLKVAVLIQTGELMENISDSFFKRGALPEPFDFPSHIGNTREAAIFTVGAFLAASPVPLLLPLLDKSWEVFKRNAKKTAIGAFAVSSAIQVAGETFAWSNDPLTPNTPDTLDAAYGIGWSAVAAYGMYRIANGIRKSQQQQAVEPEIVADRHRQETTPVDTPLH